MAAQQLRLAVGDRVECATNAGWLEGEVVALNYRDPDWPEGKVAPYQVRFDAGPVVAIPVDNPEMLRKLDPSLIPGLGAGAEGAPPALVAWCAALDNTLPRELQKDSEDGIPQSFPRQIAEHWSAVRPKPSRGPLRVVAVSADCAQQLGLDPAVLQSDAFTEFMAGNRTLPGCGWWSTNYGVHHQGRFSEQRGDGRAMSIGEVVCPDGQRREVQLKGCGATPFCRGADGRAVLRSSVREFLASEAMHFLGVPTSRCLALVATGESVRRPWYNGRFSAEADAESQRSAAPRQALKEEQCAVTCRVSQSYLRFGTLELYWVRDDMPRLRQLVEYAVKREYPDLAAVQPAATRYAAVFERIADGNARLVSEWARVGHVHGNMNSDNMMLGARTFDYGPFGMMDAYDPTLSPWEDGPEYACHRQPGAMKVNVRTLGKAFTELIESAGGSAEDKRRVAHSAGEGFDTAYDRYFSEVRRSKLGLARWDPAAAQLWERLTVLMYKVPTDYNILFRCLRGVGQAPPGDDALGAVREAFYEQLRGAAEGEWRQWLQDYAARVEAEQFGERSEVMRLANPHYVLRNWMMTLAYERAEQGDDSVIRELLAVLARPYDDQGAAAARWAVRAPQWSRGQRGVDTMS